MKILQTLALTLTIITTSSCKEAKKDTTSKEVSKEITSLKKDKKMKVLFVLTSHDKLGETGKKTGFWVEEFASPYYSLLDKGAEITIATPKGGAAPIDPSSDSPDAATEATDRFNKDDEAKARIANTNKLSDINADDFDAVFYPGGHGPLWDLANDATSIALIEKFNSQDKPVAFVCHAPAALKNVKNADGTFHWLLLKQTQGTIYGEPFGVLNFFNRTTFNRVSLITLYNYIPINFITYCTHINNKPFLSN